MKYDHAGIEKKWQEKWDGEWQYLFQADDTSKKEKCYLLVEFPYPSGEGLHMGHPRSYVAMDIIARKRRMEGYNVLYPIGWDAFGLPAENYAVKTGQHPRATTQKNIEIFRRQLKSLGISFDWSREVDTTDPKYYRWTQWMFLQFFKHGLAYKAKMPINWCLSCKIGLANEEVVDGKCERCGGEIEKRDKEQWMIAITRYADNLLADLEMVDYLPRIKQQQIDWIGKSEGALIDFGVDGEIFKNIKIKVFTTRLDTLFGATFLVLAPEHPFVERLTISKQQEDVLAYQWSARTKSERERKELVKTGVSTGSFAINPASGEKIPIWIGDFVFSTHGTGAIMAVPAHDEKDFDFALKYSLPIKEVIEFPSEEEFEIKQIVRGSGVGNSIGNPAMFQVIEKSTGKFLGFLYKNFEYRCYTGFGKLKNSEEFNGLGSEEAKEAIRERVGGIRKVQYKLRDWVFSRQRYWGEPIPIVHCGKCGYIAVPDKDLPVKLPEVEKYQPTDTGESPLALIGEWVNVNCPKCGGAAKRETDVMPNWAGSSWYFLRYIDPKNDEVFADREKLKKWMPVDWYNGGMEHTTLHLLYSRFWNKFLFNIGEALTSEPYAKRTSQGLILGEDGEKMSKSRGNVVNPDEIVKQYGADTLRCYEMFIGPFDQAAPWSSRGVVGARRFLERTHNLLNKANFDIQHRHPTSTSNVDLQRVAHQTIKKVTNDIEAMKFNTAVSQMMVCANAFAAAEKIPQELFELFVRVLSPFAPHLAEELWEKLGHAESVMTSPWPVYDPELTKDQEIELVVQINGKVRDTIVVPAGLSDEELKTRAFASEKVIRWLGGKEPQKVIVVKGRLMSIMVK